MVAGYGETGACEPFTETAVARPSGTKVGPEVDPPEGGSPGVRTSTSAPSLRSAAASPVTWPCTPPGTERLYGDTMATRIAGQGTRGLSRCRRPRGPGGAPP